MRLIRWFFLTFAAASSYAIADEITIVGHIEQPILQSKTTHALVQSTMKQIPLLKIELSDKAQQTIGKRVEKMSSEKAPLFSVTNYPRHVQLGMNNVPVLNQGGYGSCVTFAITAAIDAALNQGDYISQLCQLELGRYLAGNSYTSSGWDGSWGRLILNQMDVFGIVTKKTQQEKGCAGFTEYPLGGEDVSHAELSLLDYHQLSEAMPAVIAWSPLLDSYQAALDQTNTNNTLIDIKTALNAGDRLAFGVLLLDFDKGIVGAVGTHHGANDSWVLTPEIAKDMHDQAQFAGHEMIITGYDDDATATDDEGRTYRGLLTLRNSWGSSIGDHGNFYMSYAYFKALVLEIVRIRTLKTSQ